MLLLTLFEGSVNVSGIVNHYKYNNKRWYRYWCFNLYYGLGSRAVNIGGNTTITGNLFVNGYNAQIR
jgi:hypothetical protein